MAISETEICNLALSHLGVGQDIANLDTEKSEAAVSCKKFYDLARDEVLRDYRWPFTTKFASLALVATDPTEEWGYSYRYPSDCLLIRRIMSGSRNDSRQSLVSFKIGTDDSGLLIYTDLLNASIEYTAKANTPRDYPADFTLALSYKLAWYIAPRLTKADPFGLRKTIAESYAMTLSKAARNSFNEEQPDEELESEFIRGRE